MLYFYALISLALVISSINAAITPNTVSDLGSITAKIQKTSVKTDFNAIFAAIYYFKSHKQSARDLNLRDTITVPQFFQETFGPINAANNADGYMGFELLPSYDVNACAQACNTRAYDATSGPCIYFNIWQAIVNGTPSAVTCSMYNTFTDTSTATNTGQGDIQVSLSRGLSRITKLQDGSFQDYTCILSPNTGCPYEPSIFWTRVYLEDYDYNLINNYPAHSGTSSCMFYYYPPGPYTGFGSTLTYTQPLNTTPGTTYVISFFYTMNTLSPDPINLPYGALFSVYWNNQDVLDVIIPSNNPSFQYLNGQVEVVGTGAMDQLFFKSGTSYPHIFYLDDIAVFEKWA